jgi:L,D-transpeptidase catalytic domain/Putative peptidoglycan binding domain
VSSPTHARSRSHSWRWVALTVVAVAAIVVAGGLVAFAHLRNTPAAATSTAPPPQLRVTSTSPTGSSVTAGSTIEVELSTALAPNSPMPTLSPPVAGTWAVLSPRLLEYETVGPLVPGATETITVPGGHAGIIGSRGQHLAQTVTSAFTVAPGSVLRLQQLLAELGYLPLSFTPVAPVSSPAQEGNDQAGSFAWRWSSLPSALTSLWTEGTDNVITRGAVMDFENQNGLKTDGVAGPQVWAALLTDAQGGKGDANSWNYVLVSKALPENVTVFQNGAPVYNTPANTGVAAAPTVDGTFPVFSRYTVTTMSGTNPDGSHYSDPGIPWVSYFNGGDALHGFVRGSYGTPQSDGCVEMPPANAKVVFPYTPLGTLVTVEG